MENEMDKTTGPEVTKLQFATGVCVIVGIAIVAVTAGVAVLVFGSYGCGKLFARWLPFSPFEATAVSLLSLVTTIAVLTKMLASRSVKGGADHKHCEVCDGSHELGNDDDGDGAEEFTPNDGLRAALYASGVVKPNAPCPCGSGSRYSKCCGDGRLFRHRGEAERQ
jgi:hypothetical protein